MKTIILWLCVFTFSLGYSKHLVKNGYDTKLKEINTLLKDLRELEQEDDPEDEDFEVKMSKDASVTEKKEVDEFESSLVDPDETEEENDFENLEANESPENDEDVFTTPVVFYKVDNNNSLKKLIEKKMVNAANV